MKNLIARVTRRPRTADSILATFRKTVKELESHGVAHLDRAVAHDVAASRSRQAADAARSEADKALRAANKLETLFS